MLAKEQKCAYVAATGTGKSYVVGKYIEDNGLTNKTLVLMPSHGIRDSWGKLLPGIKRTTYQKLVKQKNLGGDYELIVCDEMHHLGGDTWGEVYRNAIEGFNGKIIGLSATPIRFLDHGRNMSEEFFEGNIVEGADLPTAISAGILPSFEYITALYNLPSRKPDEKKRNEFTEQLFSRLDFMNSTYTFQNILMKHLENTGHKVAVFVDRIQNIEEIRNLCQGIYPEANHYISHTKMGRTSARNEMAAFTEDKNMSFIYTVDMMNEGVHVKGVDCVIMFRKTESPTVYLQQIGRALTSDMAGKRIKIFDFVANHKNLKTVQGGSGSVINWIVEGISNPESQIVVRDYAMEELELLNRLRAVLNGAWTENEDNLVREKYDGAKGIPELKELLPHRTEDAIRDRAVVLGLAKTREKYTEDFLSDLRRLYPLANGVELLVEKYPQYSADIIRNKAKAMNVKRQAPKEGWTREEEEILKKHADEGIEKLMVLIPGRTKTSILARRARMGLAVSTVWGEEEDLVLREHADMMAKDIRDRYLPNRSAAAINDRKRKLGIPSRRSFWTEERKMLMKELYEEGGADAVVSNPEFAGIGKNAVRSAAVNYGFKYKGRRFWTPEEDNIIQEYLSLPDGERPSIPEFCKQMPDRTIESVRNRIKKFRH